MSPDPVLFGLTETTWFAATSIALFDFAGIVYAVGGRATEAQENHTLVHVTVLFVAGAAYAAMATDLGTITLADGRTFDVARYADWSVTTPLLLFGLALTAMHERLSHVGLLVTLIVRGVLVILTGLFAGLLPEAAESQKLLWFVIGDITFLGMLVIIWGALRVQAGIRGPVVKRVYVRHAAILTVLWTVYPVVFILGSAGLGLMPGIVTVAVICAPGVTAKGIYGTVAVIGTRQIVEARGDARETPGHHAPA